jgi:hypothetical protein
MDLIMEVLEYVTHKEIAEAMGISVQACYKVKYRNPNRYIQVAMSVVTNKVSFSELIKAINFVLEVKGEDVIVKKLKKDWFKDVKTIR